MCNVVAHRQTSIRLIGCWAGDHASNGYKAARVNGYDVSTRPYVSVRASLTKLISDEVTQRDVLHATSTLLVTSVELITSALLTESLMHDHRADVNRTHSHDK